MFELYSKPEWVADVMFCLAGLGACAVAYFGVMTACVLVHHVRMLRARRRFFEMMSLR